MEMNSDEEQNDNVDHSNEREQRIQEYLDVDKEQYLNRNEYNDIAEEEGQGEWSPEQNEIAISQSKEAPNRYDEQVEAERQDQLSGSNHQDNIEVDRLDPEQEQRFEDKYMDNSPIPENQREEEMTTTPQDTRHVPGKYLTLNYE